MAAADRARDPGRPSLRQRQVPDAGAKGQQLPIWGLEPGAADALEVAAEDLLPPAVPAAAADAGAGDGLPRPRAWVKYGSMGNRQGVTGPFSFP